MNKIVLKIDGMMCDMCEAHMNDAVRRILPDARQLKSSHAKGETEFLSDRPVDFTALREEIEKTGYRLEDYTVAPYEKKGFFARIFGK